MLEWSFQLYLGSGRTSWQNYTSWKRRRRVSGIEEVSVLLSEMLLHVMKRDVKWGVHLGCEYAFELTEHDCRVQPCLRQAKLLKIGVGNL